MPAHRLGQGWGGEREKAQNSYVNGRTQVPSSAACLGCTLSEIRTKMEQGLHPKQCKQCCAKCSSPFTLRPGTHRSEKSSPISQLQSLPKCGINIFSFYGNGGLCDTPQTLLRSSEAEPEGWYLSTLLNICHNHIFQYLFRKQIQPSKRLI